MSILVKKIICAKCGDVLGSTRLLRVMLGWMQVHKEYCKLVDADKGSVSAWITDEDGSGDEDSYLITSSDFSPHKLASKAGANPDTTGSGSDVENVRSLERSVTKLRRGPLSEEEMKALKVNRSLSPSQRTRGKNVGSDKRASSQDRTNGGPG